MERAHQIAVENLVGDAETLADWFSAAPWGQKTAYALARCMPGPLISDISERAPELVKAIGTGASRYQDWSHPLDWDQPTTAISVPEADDRESAIREAARRLGFDDVAGLTLDEVSEAWDAKRTQPRYDPRAAVRDHLAFSELLIHVARARAAADRAGGETPVDTPAQQPAGEHGGRGQAASRSASKGEGHGLA